MDLNELEQPINLRFNTQSQNIRKIQIIQEFNIVILFGFSSIEFFYHDDNNLQKLKFKTKLNLSNQQQDEFLMDILELDHSEKQEILRDK